MVKKYIVIDKHNGYMDIIKIPKNCTMEDTEKKIAVKNLYATATEYIYSTICFSTWTDLLNYMHKNQRRLYRFSDIKTLFF